MNQSYLPIDGCAYRLALGDVDGDGVNELIYGAFDGSIHCIRPDSGESLWKAALGGFPFAVSTADIDGDGRSETLVACADSHAYAIDSNGRVMWKYDTGRPVYAIDAGLLASPDEFHIACAGVDRTVTVLTTTGEKVASHEVKVVANRMALADVDGDGLDEIFVVDNRETAELLRFDGQSVHQQWRKRLTVPEEMRNWENPRASFFVFSVDVGDINGDGKEELVLGDAYFNKQAVLAINGEAEAMWLTKPLIWSAPGEKTQYEFYSTAFVRIVPSFPGHDGPVVATVSGGRLRVFDANGQLIGDAHAPAGFADLVVDGDTLYLGSTPSGDRTIYRVDLTGNWQRAVAQLDRHGLAAKVGQNLATLLDQVIDAPTQQVERKVRHHIRMFGVRNRQRVLDRTVREMQQFREAFDYPNLIPTASMKVIEPTQPLRPDGQPWHTTRWQTDSINGTMTVEQILAAARAIEERGIPTVVGIGHSCMPFVRLETIEAMLDEAPNAIVAFQSAEDEEAALVPDFARDFLAPLAELCRERGGVQCITKNKNVWWMSMPARPEVAEALFGEGRRGIVVAKTEDSNSRTPEINLFARAGLRQAGLIDRFWASTIGDLFSYCRFHQWEYPRSGSPYLRLLIAHTVMGATDFELRVAGKMPGGGKPRFSRTGREHAELFLHMLGKGLVFTPKPEQIVGFNPVGFAVHEPPDDWIIDGHNGHRPHRWPDTPAMREAMIPHNSSTWGNAPTPEHALQAVLLNKKRQFGYHVPPTPFGPFVFVPATADLDAVHGVKQWIHTDGVDVWQEGGPHLRGEAGAKMLREVFEAGAAELPFRAFGDDVFCQAIATGPKVYRVFLIDPGWVDPAERKVRLAIQLPGEASVRDLLSGEVIDVQEGSVPVVVPAGALRILEVTLAG